MANHDYIIVGAGSAGCVLASRLSADPNNRVLLLEAGGRDNHPFIHMPGGFMLMLQYGIANRWFESAPQAALNGRTLMEARGKVLGGSSSVNGMAYCRGAHDIYDKWAAMGNRGWSFADVLPYFKRSQTHELGESEYRGGSGPLKVTRAKVDNPLLLAWIEAGHEAGYPINNDQNGASQLGFGVTERTIWRGRRISTAVAYLRPAMQRPNLEVVTGALVSKVLLEGQRAVGVEYRQGNETKVARCDGEVILSAGGFISPQLLMLSGIGDADHLKSVGVKPVLDLKGVGQNLHDHSNMALDVACPLPVTDYRYFSSNVAMAKIGVQYLFARSGPAATSSVDVAAYLSSGVNGEEIDIKFNVIPSMVDKKTVKLIPEHGVSKLIFLIRPHSRGELKLASLDPAQQPIINQNYMADERDMAVMRRGLEIAREVFAQKAYAPYRGREVSPGLDVVNRTDVDAYIREAASSNYESSGTCKMGHDDLAVVNDRLQVHGIQGLWVVDTSIMPVMPNADTNGPTVMIAEKASDLILGRTLER